MRFYETSARDFFESVKAASQEAWRTHLALERMQNSELLRSSSIAGGASGSKSDVNGTRKTVARLDFEDKMRSRIEADYELIDQAHEVIYGTGEFGGGIDALLGSAYADCMYWRYMDGATWRKVSDMTNLGESTCRYYVEASLDACDAYGLEAVAKGIGIACE